MILIRVFIILQKKKKKSINDNFHSNVHNKTIRPSSEKFVMLLYQNNIKKNIENYIYFRQILQHQKIMKIPKQKPPNCACGTLQCFLINLVFKLRTTIIQ